MMISTKHDQQILRAIIQPLLIKMVYFFYRQQAALKLCFRNENVSANSTPIFQNDQVTLLDRACTIWPMLERSQGITKLPPTTIMFSTIPSLYWPLARTTTGYRAIFRIGNPVFQRALLRSFHVLSIAHVS